MRRAAARPGRGAADGRALPRRSSAAATRWTSPTRWRWPRGWPCGFDGHRRDRAAAVRGGAARRVPGHLGGPARAAPVAVRRAGRAVAGHRRRRPAPVDLRLARGERHDPQRVPPGVRAGRRARRPCCPLVTSWRNDVAVLEVANAVAEPLREPAPPCRSTSSSPAPDAGPGRVEAARVETAGDEAALVADWLAGSDGPPGRSRLRCCAASGPSSRRSSTRSRRQGVPYEVVGLGGLLLTPEVEDITALLHVVNDPSRGDQLMRLLTGPLCRLGAADLDGLMAWARHQQDLRLGVDRSAPHRGRRRRRGPAAGRGGRPTGGRRPADRDQAPDSADRASIVEAVDDPPRPGWTSWDGKRVSDVALRPAARAAAGHPQAAARCRPAAGRPRRRGRARPRARHRGAGSRGLHPGRRPAPTSTPSPTSRRRFTVSADRPNLGGFLAWLAAALKEERGLDKGYIEAVVRRRPDPDRPRGQGPGVGRRARPDPLTSAVDVGDQVEQVAEPVELGFERVADRVDPQRVHAAVAYWRSRDRM